MHLVRYCSYYPEYFKLLCILYFSRNLKRIRILQLYNHGLILYSSVLVLKTSSIAVYCHSVLSLCGTCSYILWCITICKRRITLCYMLINDSTLSLYYYTYMHTHLSATPDLSTLQQFHDILWRKLRVNTFMICHHMLTPTISSKSILHRSKRFLFMIILLCISSQAGNALMTFFTFFKYYDK